MVAVLELGKAVGEDRLRQAVGAALQMGCSDADAVRYLLTSDQLRRPPTAEIEVGPLARFDRPAPSLSGYDQLLGREGTP